MTPSGSNKKVANSLVGLSCAAVLAVYSAGYTRTRSAAERLDAQATERRVAAPSPSREADSIAASKLSPETTERPNRIEGSEPEQAAPKTATSDVPQSAVASPAPSADAAASAAEPVAAPATPAAEPPSVEAKVEAAVVILAAPVAPVALTPAPAQPAPKWKDGTYLGWGSSRHGDIQAQVIVEGGRIASATIAQCRTRYSCSVIDML